MHIRYKYCIDYTKKKKAAAAAPPPLPEEYTPHYLYTNAQSPVRWGGFTAIKKYLDNYLKPRNDQQYAGAVRALKQYRQEIPLGTHVEGSKQKHSTFNKTFYPHKDQAFECDIMDMLGTVGRTVAVKRLNKRYIYLLILINVGTKYLYIAKLRTKNVNEVNRALRHLLQQAISAGQLHHPNYQTYLQSDKGKEFFNAPVNRLLTQFSIRHYATQSINKAAAVERVIRTLRSTLGRAMDTLASDKWIDMIEDIVRRYNNTTVHSVVGMTPADAEQNYDLALFNTNAYRSAKNKPFTRDNRSAAKFNLHDTVRLKRLREHTLTKGAGRRHWGAEVFTVAKIRPFPTGYVYIVRELPLHDGAPPGQLIKGYIMEYNLQKAIPALHHRIHVLRRRIQHGKRQALVRWDGYAHLQPQWIDADDIVAAQPHLDIILPNANNNQQQGSSQHQHQQQQQQQQPIPQIVYNRGRVVNKRLGKRKAGS